MLKIKYLKKRSLVDWFRLESHSIHNTSVIWNGFLWVIGWICKSLCWKVGSGKAVLIGIDPVAGMGDSFTLSQPLVSYLQDYGIMTLDQAYIHQTDGALELQWLSAVELDLGGCWRIEWNAYISFLIYLGIMLNNDPDELRCSFNKDSGQVMNSDGLSIHCCFIWGLYSALVLAGSLEMA